MSVIPLGGYFRHFFSSDKDFTRTIKHITGFYPSNIHVYKLAFIHKSSAGEAKEGYFHCNERLEFLGDAVLNTVIAAFLFKKFPYESEGFLTQARSKIVSRNSLNEIARLLDIVQIIRYNPGSTGDTETILGNAFEALIGAIYIDKGFEMTKKFIVNRLLGEFIDLDEVLARETDFKSKLINWAQKERKPVVFTVLKETDKGPRREFIIEVRVDNTVAGKGIAFSKKAAEQKASEEACAKLKHLME
ncbi:MAG: ribonuclease III [Bacteroidetes bacterium]|nr:ribonuclease III [Bacteroidota bacterium]